jgi:hypothetical protein
MGIAVGILSFVLMLCGTYMKAAGEKEGLDRIFFRTGLAGSLFFVFVWLWAAFETENPVHQDQVLLILRTAEALGILFMVSMLCGIYFRIGEKRGFASVLFGVGLAGALLSIVLWVWAWLSPSAVL